MPSPTPGPPGRFRPPRCRSCRRGRRSGVPGGGSGRRRCRCPGPTSVRGGRCGRSPWLPAVPRGLLTRSRLRPCPPGRGRGPRPSLSRRGLRRRPGCSGRRTRPARRRVGVAGVRYRQDAGSDAGRVVEVVGVVVACRGWAQAGCEVAQACPYRDAGSEGEYGGFDLGGAVRRGGDLAGDGVPREVDGRAGPAFSAEVAQDGVVACLQYGFCGEGRPFGVVGGAQA